MSADISEEISEETKLRLKVIRSIIWHHRGYIEYNTLCRKFARECRARLIDVPDTDWVRSIVMSEVYCPDLELLICGYQPSERDPECKRFIVFKRYGVKTPVH